MESVTREENHGVWGADQSSASGAAAARTFCSAPKETICCQLFVSPSNYQLLSIWVIYPKYQAYIQCTHVFLVVAYFRDLGCEVLTSKWNWSFSRGSVQPNAACILVIISYCCGGSFLNFFFSNVSFKSLDIQWEFFAERERAPWGATLMRDRSCCRICLSSCRTLSEH